jgi:TolA-binding protein
MAGSASAALWQLSSWRLPWSFGRRPAPTAPASQEHPRARRPAHPADPPSAATAPEMSPEIAPEISPLIEPRPSAPSAASPPSGDVRVALARPIPSARAPAAVPRPPIADSSAPALFRAANQARRAGELAEAQRLYRALQAGFPGSAEATLSFLSLGDLSLSRDAFADALEQFDAYLHSGDTALAEEALVGRARTLARLGRTADERETWQRLLASHPRSDYRWRAQQRLDALSAIAP